LDIVLVYFAVPKATPLTFYKF